MAKISCKQHPEKLLERIVITNSMKYAGRNLHRYVCMDCYIAKNGQHHKGYECPRCNEVSGMYKIERLDPREVEAVDPSITVMYNRTTYAFKYICPWCNSVLGVHIDDVNKVKKNLSKS
jgi:hypothetical protein